MKKRILIVISILIWAIVFALLILSLSEIYAYECPYHKYLNLTCPGCGTTRMLKALLNFDIILAFKYNPLMFILLIIGIIYSAIAAKNYILKNEKPKISYKVLSIIAVLLIVYFVLRNVPDFYFLRIEYLE